jgi:hypothetical protein
MPRLMPDKEGRKMVEDKSSISLALIEQLSEKLGTDRINFNFGTSGEPGYSEYTPGSYGEPGYIEVLFA